MQTNDKSEMITVPLNLNKRANADVIRQLEAQDNVREYLIRLRMRRSAWMLANTSMSVQEIAASNRVLGR